MLAMSTKRTKKMTRGIGWPVTKQTSGSTAGYSLIELLVVIAIISIITAILIPVIGSAQESGRRGTVMDDMSQIQSALERYKLDHRMNYPPVLFAYAPTSGSDTMASVSGDKANGPTDLVGLFPEYIKNASVFTDPNNPVHDVNSTATVSANVNSFDPNNPGSLDQTTTMAFFQGDAYDVNPQITGPTSISTGTNATYVTRYQTAWTSTPMPSGFPAPYQFPRQMDQADATDTTYVTMTSYHVQTWGKVVVLFKGGQAKVFDTSVLISPGCGPDTSNIAASGGVANANFWWITPSGSCQQKSGD